MLFNFSSKDFKINLRKNKNPTNRKPINHCLNYYSSSDFFNFKLIEQKCSF